jgi:hypothetical protein
MPPARRAPVRSARSAMPPDRARSSPGPSCAATRQTDPTFKLAGGHSLWSVAAFFKLYHYATHPYARMQPGTSNCPAMAAFRCPGGLSTGLRRYPQAAACPQWDLRKRASGHRGRCFHRSVAPLFLSSLIIGPDSAKSSGVLPDLSRGITFAPALMRISAARKLSIRAAS